MKKAGLFLGFWLVFLFFASASSKPSPQQLAALDAAQPALDSVVDVLRYDSLGLTRPGSGPIGGVRLLDSSGYWIAVHFSSDDLPFTLQAVFFQVDNSLINIADGCSIYVADDLGGRPDSILTGTAVPAPLPNKLRSVALPDTIRFSRAEKFWILLGPVPGGPDNDEIGDGWWGLRDTTAARGKSFVSFDNRGTWDSLNTGNWVLRAGGEKGRGVNVVINELMFRPDTFSTDFARNHQWVELYNPGPEQDSALVRFVLANRGMDSVRILPKFIFPANSYLVIHFYDSLFGNDLNLSDGVGHIFFGKRTFFKERSDACGLFFTRNVSSPAPDSVRDVLPWDGRNLSHNFVFQPGPAEAAAVAAGRLNNLVIDFLKRVRDPDRKVGPLVFPPTGTTVGRDSLSTDREADVSFVTDDFDFHGGRDAAAPTMGRRNQTPSMQTALAAADPTPQSSKPWTLMLFMAGDAGARLGKVVEPYYYDLVNQLERSLPVSPANLNVVLFFDGGRIVVPSASNGATLRGALQFDTTGALANLRVVPGDEVNTALNADGLKDFLSWARTTFPASRYALAIKGDGIGWQGCLTDGQSLDSIVWLELADLKKGLAEGMGSDRLDLLVLDAPLMGQLEVAAQVDSFARFLVATPEMIEPAEVDYSALAKKLENDPGVGARDLALFAVDSAAGRRGPANPFAAWSALDLDSLRLLLLPQVNTLAQNLLIGVDDVCGAGNATDNFQLKIREALVKTEHYGKQSRGMADYIDLKDFASRVTLLSTPGCIDHKGGASQVNALLANGGKVVVSRLQGSRHSSPNFGGLSIYFPSSREKNPSIAAARKDSLWTADGDTNDYAYDRPGLLRLLIFPFAFPASLPVLYAADGNACYPRAVFPQDPCSQSDTIAQIHPFPPVRDLEFVARYSWDEFLIRYYKPAADAGADVQSIVNQAFGLNGSGSSDADSDSLRYFWDLFAAVDDPFVCDSVEREDLDKNCADETDDDRDLVGAAPVYLPGYDSVAEFVVTLHVWDSHYAIEPVFARSYHTDRDSLRVVVTRGFARFVEEDNFTGAPLPANLYRDAFIRANIPINTTQLLVCPAREGLLLSQLGGEEPIFWQTGRDSTCTFPVQAINVFRQTLNDTVTRRGAWVFSPKMGKYPAYQSDTAVSNFFLTHFQVQNASPGILSSTFLVPRNADSTFLRGFDTLYLRPGTALETLTVSSAADHFPLLFNDAGKVVAAAHIRNLGSAKRGSVFSSFGLEHIRLDNPVDSLRLSAFLNKMADWLSSPTPRPTGRPKGDLNGDGSVSPSDGVLLLNCIFINPGGPGCELAYADMNCDAVIAPNDLVILLLLIFQGLTGPC